MNDPEIEAFYAKHAECGPSHVVVAHIYRQGSHEITGVFSTLQKAREWVDSFGADDHDDVAAIFSPYVIDTPEFGNVPERMRQ